MTEQEFDDKYERWVMQKCQTLVRMHMKYNPSESGVEPNVAIALMREVAAAGGAFVR